MLLCDYYILYHEYQCRWAVYCCAKLNLNWKSSKSLLFEADMDGCLWPTCECASSVFCISVLLADCCCCG